VGLRQQLYIAKDYLKDFEVPSLPKEVIELQKKLNSTEFPDINDIASIIKKNTVLSAELIKVANQKQFKPENIQEEIISVKTAVTSLGLDSLKTLIFGVAFKSLVQDEVFDDLMEHSVAVANVAADLSSYLTGVSSEEAYLAGLFHNAGAIVMAMRFDGYNKTFYNTITNCYSGISKETAKYGTSHGVFGLLVAKEWELYSHYSQVILLHHQKDVSIIKEDEVRTLVVLIQLATTIVSEALFHSYQGDEVAEMKKRAMKDLMISDEIVSEIRRALMTDNLV